MSALSSKNVWEKLCFGYYVNRHHIGEIFFKGDKVFKSLEMEKSQNHSLKFLIFFRKHWAVIINQHDGTLVTLSNVATAFVKQYEEIKKSTLVRHISYPVSYFIY